MGFPGSVAFDEFLQLETTKRQTTDATQTVMWNKTLGDKMVLRGRIICTAMKSDGTDRATYERVFTAYRAGGGATLAGAVVVPVPDYESDATWDASITVSSNDVQFKITGKSSTTINWRCRVEFVAG